MALPPHLAQSLNGRRQMEITDSESSYASANGSRTRDTRRQSLTQNTERRSSSQLQRAFVTPAQSSISLNLATQTSTGRAGHNTNYSSGSSFQQSRNMLGNTPSGAHGVMANATNPPTTPRIMVETYNQEQPPLPGLSWRHNRQHLTLSAMGTPNQFVAGVGSRRDSTQTQAPSNSSSPKSLLAVEWDLPVTAIMDQLPNSSIYVDVISRTSRIPRIRGGAVLRSHPWPPNHTTVTGAGFDPKGGKYIQLTLRNKVGQDIELPLTIIPRELLMDGGDANIDIVLGRDYEEKLNGLQIMSMGLQQQLDSTQFLSPSYENWQMAGRSQNGTLSSGSPAFAPGHQNAAGFNSVGWPSTTNRMLQPPYQADSNTYTTIPSTQSSSNLVASSATSLDGLFAPTPYYRETVKYSEPGSYDGENSRALTKSENNCSIFGLEV
ncbi:hypothetical protein F5Y03DRAFT_396804 [Xylaria venustula]|nr:hypothetical protein F5Y03DRAFT_396804 [Xylaria venustula]